MPSIPNPRKALWLAVLVVAVAVLSAVPSIAGTAYVSLASNITVDGMDQSTELVVANPTTDNATISMFFIAVGDDGADRPEEFQAPEFVVDAGTTRTFRNLVGGTGRGILEVTFPSSVSISARLVSTDDTGEEHRTAIPVVGSNQVINGGKFHVVNELYRDETKRTALGLINLSQSVNECRVQTFRSSGSALIGLTTIAVPPVSSVYFDDAVLASGVNIAGTIRIHVLCTNDSYAYGVVRDIVSGDLNTLLPAVDGSSNLVGPGARTACEPGAFCFEQQGPFLTPTPSRPFVFYDLLPPLSNYSQIRVNLTFQHGGWSSRNNAGFHGIFWLFRNLRWLDTFVYFNARGPGKNLIVNNALVNNPPGVSQRTTANVALQVGQTYKVEYIYDAGNRTTTTKLFDADGAELATMVDRTTLSTVAIQNGFRIEMGLEVGPVEVPSYGWTYSDLFVSFIP